ncbi:hypothetical protein BC835DRAFT_1413616 [Cytidiella melzeri]|nr:hypothetical protein BC835DRAFT_1413616 [Cytidiella melzeri]
MIDHLDIRIKPDTSELDGQRHPSLYFTDGDIVISATSRAKSYTELYRVDRIFLARHSPVFKDMFSLGKGRDDEQYDGAPRVHLPEDAEDVAALLGALYHTSNLPLTRYSPDTPQKVQGIMRLAVKYDVESIRTTIMKHIEGEWPHTLADWEKLQNERAKLYLSASPPPTRLYDHFPEPASAIAFAMEFHCPSILPAAFYELAAAPTGDPSIHWGFLHHTDLLRLIAGKSALVAQWMPTVGNIERNASSGYFCSNRFHQGCFCRKIAANCIIDTLQDADDNDPSTPRVADPLSYLRHFDVAKNRQSAGFSCDKTVEGISNSIKSEAQRIWDQLPEYFPYTISS